MGVGVTRKNGKPLSAVAVQRWLRRQQHRRLSHVHDHVNRPHEATQAAAELLRWYARYGAMEDPAAQAEIEEGMRRALLKVAQAGLDSGGRCWMTPLDYFDAARRTHPGRPPAVMMQSRAATRRAHGDDLSWDDFLKYLTTDGKKTLPPERRAKDMQAVERWGVGYVRDLYGKNFPEPLAKEWLRESFGWLPWDEPERPMEWLP